MSQYVRAAAKLEADFRIGNPKYLNIPVMVTDIANLLQSWHGSISTAGDKRGDLIYDLSSTICKILLVLDSAWYDDDLQPLDGEVAEFLDTMYDELDCSK